MSDMIFDRTLDDVNKAIDIRNSKVKTFQTLSDSEKIYLERGTITINTLNRIEQKQEDLHGIFNDMGYFNMPIVHKTWTLNDMFDENELRRIFDNDRALKSAFFYYAETPDVPVPSYYYESINALEKILFDLDVMINDIKSRYRFCNTFNCGED